MNENWAYNEFWGSFWGQFIIEILGGTISALIFLLIVLFLMKPTIRIAPFICKGLSNFPGEGELCFFKFVNTSVFSAYDIRVELYLLQKYSTPPSGMMNNRMTPLSLVRNHVAHMPPYRPRWWRKEAAHAYRLRTEENLTEILKDNFNSILIQITLKHGLTGLTKVYNQEYCDLSEIKKGKFTYGTAFDFVEENN